MNKLIIKRYIGYAGQVGIVLVSLYLLLFARHGHNLMGESPERAPIAGSA